MNTALPSPPLETPHRTTARVKRRRSWTARLAAPLRWLHIYLSLLGFATLIFFSLTGITLNHPDWLLGTVERRSQVEGEMNTRWLQPEASSAHAAPETAATDAAAADLSQQLARLEIVEHLRSQHQLRGAVSEFRADEFECLVSFKGPGYSADAFIDRETGRYDLTVIDQGAVALLNDLHKGRHSGTAWSWVIDLSAILMALAGLTGLLLLLYLRRRRATGLVTTFVGGLVLVAIFLWFVP